MRYMKNRNAYIGRCFNAVINDIEFRLLRGG